MNNEFAVENALDLYYAHFKTQFNYFIERMNGETDEEIVLKINTLIEEDKQQKYTEGIIT